MNVFRSTFVPACVLALVGCSTSHGVLDRIDSGASPDGGTVLDAGSEPVDSGAFTDSAPRPDSGTDGRYYELVDAPGALVTHERCQAADGMTTMFHVRVRVGSDCDHPAPTVVEVDASTRAVTLTTHLWVERGRTCIPAPPGVFFDFNVPVRGLSVGAWNVSGMPLATPFRVGARSPEACTLLTPLGRGGRCNGDCDCENGLSCIAWLGDEECQSQCQRPAEIADNDRSPVAVHLSCASGEALGGGIFGAICVPELDEGYCATSPCPAGMQCIGGVAGPPVECVWTPDLSGALRHACVTNTDCAPGLDCVRGRDGLNCERRCISTSMRCGNIDSFLSCAVTYNTVDGGGPFTSGVCESDSP